MPAPAGIPGPGVNWTPACAGVTNAGNAMTPLKDHAIVLRLTEYSETSQIVTLLAAERGLLRLIAKGARRSTRQRFATGLDLLERGELGYVPARGDAQLGTLTDWHQRETYGGLRRELVRLQAALYAIELVAGLLEEDDPHPELYPALERLLTGLSGADAPAELVPTFQAALLRAIGYAPNLQECVSCNRAVQPGPVVYFSAASGGALCRDCEAPYVEKRLVPRGLVGQRPPEGDARAWFDLLDYYLSYVAGRRFKTAATLGRLLGAET